MLKRINSKALSRFGLWHWKQDSKDDGDRIPTHEPIFQPWLKVESRAPHHTDHLRGCCLEQMTTDMWTFYHVNRDCWISPPTNSFHHSQYILIHCGGKKYSTLLSWLLLCSPPNCETLWTCSHDVTADHTHPSIIGATHLTMTATASKGGGKLKRLITLCFFLRIPDTNSISQALMLCNVSLFTTQLRTGSLVSLSEEVTDKNCYPRVKHEIVYCCYTGKLPNRICRMHSQTSLHSFRFSSLLN